MDDHFDANSNMYCEINNEDSVTQKKGNRRVRYYPSNKQQTIIRNAVTGVEYPWKVGSTDETRLFKMVDATGTCDSDGRVIRSKDVIGAMVTNHLYYDSPDQCMKHLNVTISPEWIEKWRNNVHERFSLI